MICPARSLDADALEREVPDGQEREMRVGLDNGRLASSGDDTTEPDGGECIWLTAGGEA